MWPHAGIVSGRVGDVCEKGMNVRVLLPSLFRLFYSTLRASSSGNGEKRQELILRFIILPLDHCVVSWAFNANQMRQQIFINLEPEQRPT